MPDVVAAGIRWTAAQAEFNAAAATHDEDRLNQAVDAYDASSAEFNATVLGYIQRLPTGRALAAYRKLADGLSNMVEGDRLQEGDIPDDYQWLVVTLEKIAGLDPTE